MESKMEIKQQLSADKSSNKTDSASIEKGTIRRGLKAWAKKLSVEAGGIERVTDEERGLATRRMFGMLVLSGITTESSEEMSNKLISSLG
jgi:hypothetical protein